MVLWNTSHQCFCMLLKLVFRIKLSDPKQTVAIPTESRSQTKSLWNKSMWSYLKNLSRKASLEQPVARILVNSLDVNSEEAEPGSQTQPEMSRFKKQMNSDSSRGSPIGYCCPERSYGFPYSKRERESNKGTDLKINGDLSVKHAKEQTKGSVTIFLPWLKWRFCTGVLQGCSHCTKSGKRMEATTVGEGIAGDYIKRT